MSAISIFYICEFFLKHNTNLFQEEFRELLRCLLTLVITENVSHMWAFSKPLLALVLVNQREYQLIREQTVDRMFRDPSMKQTILGLLDQLMEGVTASLNAKNRENIAENLLRLSEGGWNN